jgi:hypothetical protein
MADHVETQKQETNKPIVRYRMGAVHASLFRNTSDRGGEYYTLSVENRYQKDGEWRSTNTYLGHELSHLQEVVTAAQATIQEEIQKRGNGKDQENDKGLQIIRQP